MGIDVEKRTVTAPLKLPDLEGHGEPCLKYCAAPSKEQGVKGTELGRAILGSPRNGDGNNQNKEVKHIVKAKQKQIDAAQGRPKREAAVKRGEEERKGA